MLEGIQIFKSPEQASTFETKFSKVYHSDAYLKSLILKPGVTNIRIYSDLLQGTGCKTSTTNLCINLTTFLFVTL